MKAQLQLFQDRKKSLFFRNEAELEQMIMGSYRSSQEEIYKASAIIEQLLYINSCSSIIGKCDILFHKTHLIVKSNHDIK